MIRPEALARLSLLAGAGRAPLVANGRDLEVIAIQPGQRIDGRVEQQLRDGYIVSVGGRSYDIKLPGGARPGDVLRLVYMNDNPRPTFALLRIDHANDHAGPSLSDAGKLLAMLRQPGFDAPDAPAARATNPLFASQIPPAPLAATLLREALADSGLFYESHQAQWILGTRSTEQLQREPQSRLAPNQPAALDVAQPMTPVVEHANPSAQALPAGTDPGAETGAPPQSEQMARPPAHPDTFSIIRQQLSALESGHVTWSGLVWPGQVMQWQVGEDASGEQDESEVARTWRTELKLALPNIGDVHAIIELGASGAKVRVVADSEQHARQLREAAPVLAVHFNASGIAVNALEVSHGSDAA